MARRMHTLEMLKTLGKQVIGTETNSILPEYQSSVKTETNNIPANDSDILQKETIRICEEEEPEIVIEEEQIEENNISVVIQPKEECILTIKPKKGMVISYIQSFFIFYEVNFNIQYNLIGYSEDKKSFMVGVKNIADFESKISVFYRVVF